MNVSELLKKIRLHRHVGPAIIDALHQVLSDLGVEVFKWNEFGGALNVRLMKGGTLLSTHSWGIAIDLNPTRACWQCPTGEQHPAITAAFKDRGFTWGGDWPVSHADKMHFDACGAR